MNTLVLILAGVIFTKSLVFFNYNLIMYSKLKSTLLLHVNNSIVNETLSIFSVDKTAFLFLLMTALLSSVSLLSNWQSLIVFNSQKFFLVILL